MRYLIFAGANYYACGGANDFIGAHDILGNAVTFAQKTMDNDHMIDWWHIYDTVNLEIVEQSEVQAYCQ